MKKLWQLCACAAGVLAGLWLTARILLPVGLPFLLGLGLARLARPLAARLRRLPRGLAAFLSVTAVCLAAAAVLTGLGWALRKLCHIWLLLFTRDVQMFPEQVHSNISAPKMQAQSARRGRKESMK